MQIKDFINFSNSFVLFCFFHLSLFILNEQNVKMGLRLKFYIPLLENQYTFQMQDTTLRYFDNSG